MDQANAEKLLAATKGMLDVLTGALGTIREIADEPKQKQLRGVVTRLMAHVAVELHVPLLRDFPQLDTHHEKPEPDPPLSPEEQRRVEQLSTAEIDAIDEALLEDACSHWRKVARIVGTALDRCCDRIPEVPYQFYAQRVRHLVGAGRLESQGNLEFLRFSEVRLPSAAAVSSDGVMALPTPSASCLEQSRDVIDPEIMVIEAEALINAAMNCTDDEREDTLVRWAHEILEPLVDARMPEALWLKTSLGCFEHEPVSREEFDREYLRLVREAADGGNANAQFCLAQELDEDATVEESARYFALAAAQGHAYAQWVHGLNLLAGRGIPQDQQLGLASIQESANAKFEGAIRFLAEAYGSGSHGFPKDEKESARWWKRLSDKNLVHY